MQQKIFKKVAAMALAGCLAFGGMSSVAFCNEVDQMSEAASESESEKMSEAASESESEKITEPASESESEEMSEAASESESEEMSEAASESESEEMTEPASESESEEMTEPVSESESEEMTEPDSESEDEKMTEKDPETQIEPVSTTSLAPSYVISVPPNVSLSNQENVTVTASGVTNLDGQVIKVQIMSTNGSQAGIALGNGMLVSGEEYISYTFSNVLEFDQDESKDINITINEQNIASKPAGTYTDTLTFCVELADALQKEVHLEFE